MKKKLSGLMVAFLLVTGFSFIGINELPTEFGNGNVSTQELPTEF